ncbi:MAG: HipA domain-containing protein [Lachnospiraceae bacterium]|nr:HipA domain-containing protein [Lachnospiraceae bacterium]
MSEGIDFTNCERITGKAYNGANGKKIAVKYEGCQYMLKFPPSGQLKPTELSYTNSCFSEHIASSIFNILDVEAQKTILGTFDVAGKMKIVCACRDFTADGKQLFDFCSIKNTILDSDSNGSGTELSDILETIEKQQFVGPDRLVEHFWEVFVIDALLGNFDRHNGNWGFLYNPISKTSDIAPVYDCGSCLLPQADDDIMHSVLENENALYKRVFQFPTSALKLDGRKINYYDFLIKAEYPDCNEAVKKIYERLNMKKIDDFIDEVPYISDFQKTFYKKYIDARVSLILAPAYEMIMLNKIKN